MIRPFGSRGRYVLVLIWSLLTISLLFGISVMVMSQPSFPLNLGLVQTTGRPGLWIILLPALAGFSGVLLMRHFRRLGEGLLGMYSIFWGAMIAGALPVVWNAQSSFCIESLKFCITSPWVGRLMAIGVAAPFLLVGYWCLRRMGGETRL
jgi:hypothetical protein